MKRDKEYYLERGFDDRTAAYFASGLRRICAVAANDDFTLTLTFDNRERRIFDVKNLIKSGTVFEHIKDIQDFKRVYLDEDAVVSWDIDPLVDSKKYWNNKIDISPVSCYLDSVCAPLAQPGEI